MARLTDFERRVQLIAEHVQTLESAADPRVQSTARELVSTLLELHETGISRILKIVREAGDLAEPIIDRVAEDALTRNLLLLYGLHPEPLDSRIANALEKARPYLLSHGGNVELVAIDEGGAVKLRLEGSCHGCPSSALTLKLAIEDAIRDAAPDVTSIVVEGVVERDARATKSLPIIEADAGTVESPGPVWREVGGLASLPAGTIRVLDVAGHSIVFCRSNGQVYAYGNLCPACEGPIEGPELAGSELRCDACGQRFDVVHAGRGLDVPELHLVPFPLLMEGENDLRVALPVDVANRGAG